MDSYEIENSLLKHENSLLSKNLEKLREPGAPSPTLYADCGLLLQFAAQHRRLIGSLESKLTRCQFEYEQDLNASLELSRVSSKNPELLYLPRLVIQEESAVETLEEQLKSSLAASAKEIASLTVAAIQDRSELSVSSAHVPSTPSFHRSGARVNPAKLHKYLTPL